MRSAHLLICEIAAVLGFGMLTLPANASETANVYVQANNGPLSAPNLESASDSRQTIDPTYGVGGVGSASASLADGYLRVSATSINQYIGELLNEGNASAMAGLNTRIFLNGPSNVGGNVLVTMNVSGNWSPGSVNAFNGILAQAGNWLGPPNAYGGFTGQPGTTGVFQVFDETINGVTSRSFYDCQNCNFGGGTSAFPVSVSALLPFSPGQSFVDYAARLEVYTRGGIIDASHSASFSIILPQGFTYTSALAFQTAPVPEPSTYGMLVAGLGILACVARRRLTGTQSS